jgi:tRNA G18 (ribose-2'-O)-methylase SpoU
MLQATRGCGPSSDGQDAFVTDDVARDVDDVRLDPFRGLRESERAFLRPPPAGRRPAPAFVVEGARVIARALDSGYPPQAILVDAAARGRINWVGRPGLPVVVADHELIRRVSGLGVFREAVGIFTRPPEPEVPALVGAARRILVLEGVANPVNLGVIIRSAAALGVDCTLLDAGCTDPLYRRAVRGSMGAVLTHPWGRITALPAGLEVLRTAGFVVVALVTDRRAQPLATAVTAAGPRVALVLGTEGDGITDAGRGASDVLATVPMRGGVDSLNVGAAAAVACYLLGAVS